MNGVRNSEVTQYHQDCNDAVRFVKASFSLHLIAIETATDAESRWDEQRGRKLAARSICVPMVAVAACATGLGVPERC